MGRWDTFLSLPPPSTPGAYSVVGGGGACLVARSHEGFPAVLLRFDGGARDSAPRRLANMRYEPPRPIDLLRAGRVIEQVRLAALECRTTDAQLGAYFFRVVGALILDSEGVVDEAQFDAGLDAVVTLFRALQRPGVRSVQGLWAELAVIAWSADPRAALAAWHSNPHQLHDFAVGSFRLEVKGTLKALREHAFLLDQLSSMSPGVTLIASMMLAETDDGMNVADLVSAIGGRLGVGTEAARRLEVIVADSLGQGWREAGDLRLSLEHARRSLRFYRGEDVPTIPQPVPPAVRDVRFVADLSDIVPVASPVVRALAPALAPLLPASDTASG